MLVRMMWWAGMMHKRRSMMQTGRGMRHAGLSRRYKRLSLRMSGWGTMGHNRRGLSVWIAIAPRPQIASRPTEGTGRMVRIGCSMRVPMHKVRLLMMQ